MRSKLLIALLMTVMIVSSGFCSFAETTPTGNLSQMMEQFVTADGEDAETLSISLYENYKIDPAGFFEELESHENQEAILEALCYEALLEENEADFESSFDQLGEGVLSKELRDTYKSISSEHMQPLPSDQNMPMFDTDRIGELVNKHLENHMMQDEEFFALLSRVYSTEPESFIEATEGLSSREFHQVATGMKQTVARHEELTLEVKPEALKNLSVEDSAFVAKIDRELAAIPVSDAVNTMDPSQPVSVIIGGSSASGRTDRDGKRTSEKASFKDVHVGDWYEVYVNDVAKRKIMTGVADQTFAPQMDFSRAMLVQTLYNMEGHPKVSEKAKFKDVQDGEWYADAIAWASSNGIVNGVTDEEFQPGAGVTREQAMTMLYRYSQAKKYPIKAGDEETLNSFTDAKEISDYAMPSMRWAVEEKVIEGVADKVLNPAGSMTRAMAAAVLSRLNETNSWVEGRVSGASVEELLNMAEESDGWIAERVESELVVNLFKDPSAFAEAAVDAELDNTTLLKRMESLGSFMKSIEQRPAKDMEAVRQAADQLTDQAPKDVLQKVISGYDAAK